MLAIVLLSISRAYLLRRVGECRKVRQVRAGKTSMARRVVTVKSPALLVDESSGEELTSQCYCSTTTA
jgi:hypothetical protein